MANDEEPAAGPFAQPPAPRRSRRKWLALGGIAFVLTLTLGTLFVTGQALAVSSERLGSLDVRHMPTMMPSMMPTRMPGPCGGQLTVSSVTNHTITVTGSNGNTTTVYVSSHTQYVKNGQTVSVSAVRVGSHIYVVGTCNNQGHVIRATRIEISG